MDPNVRPMPFRASHAVVTIDTFESQFTRLGFATWKCAECEIWRVPGNHCPSPTPASTLVRSATPLWLSVFPSVSVVKRFPGRRAILFIGREGRFPYDVYVCAATASANENRCCPSKTYLTALPRAHLSRAAVVKVAARSLHTKAQSHAAFVMSRVCDQTVS
jgi:hypothetical protein